jgi:predicted lipoprotein with Yx(FWY)xxD motif
VRTARNARLAALACAAVACLAACGTGKTVAATVPAWEVTTTVLPGAGRVLADGHGYTLYAYMPDHQGRSQCSGLCAQQWPPLVLPADVTHPVARGGAHASLLGTVRRPGGAMQVTYNGWPWYLWQGDQEPGQATGQADNMGLWYVLSASGSVDKSPVQGQSGD